MNQQVEFLTIGDTATDVFIRIKDAHLSCNLDHSACEICMKFGDKIPFEHATEVVAVGNSANAAVAAARFGLKSGIITHVGDDIHGKNAIAEFLKQGVSTKMITTEKGKKTNYHYVLWYQSERTILIKHEQYSYVWKDPAETPRWLYLSSLGSHTEAYHQDIIRYITEHPRVKVVFQPGTFQLSLGISALRALYERTEVFVCNVEEARSLLNRELKTDNFSHAPIEKLLTTVSSFGPRYAVITDGPKGAYAYDGEKMLFQPPYPDIAPPLERTGAGDAFAATFASALALGESFEQALRLAPINSMSVVQHIGAQQGLLKKSEILEYLSKANTAYVARPM